MVSERQYRQPVERVELFINLTENPMPDIPLVADRTAFSDTEGIEYAFLRQGVSEYDIGMLARQAGGSPRCRFDD
jgi:hypothetical protein